MIMKLIYRSEQERITWENKIMATNVSIIDYKYRGLVCGNREPAVTLGERTITTGHL